MDEKEWKHRRPQKAYKRSKRKELILKQLQIWFKNGYATEVTSYKLAKALELTPAQTFRDILNEMVEEGTLERRAMDKTGRLPGWFYALPATSPLITEKYGKRRIVVKHKGVVSGQLEMGI